MKINSLKLIYFSPTSTTGKVVKAVKAIAKELGCEKQAALDLTSPIIRSKEVPKIDEDLVLLGMPVYEEKISGYERFETARSKEKRANNLHLRIGDVI